MKKTTASPHPYRLSATDLSNYISCRHLTLLDKQAADGTLEKPTPKDPYAALVQELGMRHEAAYVAHLQAQGHQVADLREGSDQIQRTLDAMREGAEVIVQAKLDNGKWGGYADLLLKVDKKSNLGDWSYKVADTKLAQHTKAGTVLQLCVYSDLVSQIQGVDPDHIHVIMRKPFNTS